MSQLFQTGQQSPEAQRALQEADIKKWRPLIKELGIKGE